MKLRVSFIKISQVLHFSFTFFEELDNKSYNFLLFKTFSSLSVKNKLAIALSVQTFKSRFKFAYTKVFDGLLKIIKLRYTAARSSMNFNQT